MMIQLQSGGVRLFLLWTGMLCWSSPADGAEIYAVVPGAGVIDESFEVDFEFNRRRWNQPLRPWVERPMLLDLSTTSTVDIAHNQVNSFSPYPTMTFDQLIQWTQDDPVTPDAWAELGIRYLQRQQSEDAFIAFTEAVRIQPSHEVALQLATGLMAVGGWHTSAIPMLERALLIHPLNHTMRFNLACCLARTGETQRAIHELYRLLYLGYDALHLHLGDADFDAIRATPEFQRLSTDVWSHVMNQLRHQASSPPP